MSCIDDNKIKTNSYAESMYWVNGCLHGLDISHHLVEQAYYSACKEVGVSQLKAKEVWERVRNEEAFTKMEHIKWKLDKLPKFN